MTQPGTRARRGLKSALSPKIAQEGYLKNALSIDKAAQPQRSTDSPARGSPSQPMRHHRCSWAARTLRPTVLPTQTTAQLGTSIPQLHVSPMFSDF